MRRIMLLTAAFIFLMAPAANAKIPFLKKAKDAGIASVKDCKSCHGDKNAKDSLNDAGKWLVAQKVAKQAAEVDPLWIKDYKGK